MLQDFDGGLPDSVEDINGTLVFKNVSESDRGQYTCHASNEQGKINASVVVTPVIAPKFLVSPNSQGPIQVNEMGSVMIHCSATGDPLPNIQWDKDFDYLNISNSDTSRMIILENGTLYLQEVHLEDEGLYGCTIGSRWVFFLFLQKYEKICSKNSILIYSKFPLSKNLVLDSSGRKLI